MSQIERESHTRAQIIYDWHKSKQYARSRTCLQASMEMSSLPDEADFLVGDLDFLSALALVAVAFFAFEGAERVDFAMVVGTD